MNNISQQWQEKKYCKEYAEMWDISTNDVHYGWLSPGESTLNLIDPEYLNDSHILDIGCGMGENLVSLYKKAKKPPHCIGLDISEHMLAYATQKVLDEFSHMPDEIRIVQSDMRQLGTLFPGIKFKLILSVYSLEYLNSVRELREVLASVFHKLHEDGAFIFCFSHPLQHCNHDSLRNMSAPSIESDHSSNLIFSFYDVINCLKDVGFTIDRIVEQQTSNPSKITYEEGMEFPYHFHEKRNPCDPKYDHVSNRAPHTIIYKAKKVVEKQPTLNLSNSRCLWGELRNIHHEEGINYSNHDYIVEIFEKPFDDVVAVCEVLNIEVTSDTLANEAEQNVTKYLANTTDNLVIKSNSILGIIDSELIKLDLEVRYYGQSYRDPDTKEHLSATYVRHIDPLDFHLSTIFPGQQLGLLVFLNGEEPGNGKVSIESITPHPGDCIQLIYIIMKNRSKKRRTKLLYHPELPFK